MSRKTSSFGIIFLVLLIFNTIVSTNAFEYGAGVKKNQEIIWKCNVCNELEMDAIFSNSWNGVGIFTNLSKGKRMKWEINEVEINGISTSINTSIWEWTAQKNWGQKDYEFQISYLSNPHDYPAEINFSNYMSFVPFWFPIPVGEYMGSLDLFKWYDVDNRVLPTLNVEISRDAISSNFPSKNIKILAIYNDQGILNTYKIYTEGNDVIVDIAYDHLPFYVIPVLVGLGSILSLGIVLYIIKKRKSFTNSSLNTI